MPFDQGQFNFDAPGNEAGWKRWRQELEEQQRAFEKRWGVRLGKHVTVNLIDHAKPLRGRLEWIDREAGPAGPPKFRIGTVEFRHEEIESMVMED